MCHPISILKTQNRMCIESPDTIKVNIFFLFIARLPSETGHCYVIFPRVNKSHFLFKFRRKTNIENQVGYLSSKRPITMYMTRIDNNALFIPVITSARVVQWKNVGLLIWGSTVRITATAVNNFSFIVKFPEYFQTLFIFSLSFLYVLFLGRCMACRILTHTEFDLLLSTYSKRLNDNQFRCYLVCMYNCTNLTELHLVA